MAQILIQKHPLSSSIVMVFAAFATSCRKNDFAAQSPVQQLAHSLQFGNSRLSGDSSYGEMAVQNQSSTLP